MINMENGIPKIIYLQIGDEVDLSFTSFNELDHEFVTWSDSKCLSNDIEYINKEYSDQQNKQLLDEIERLKLDRSNIIVEKNQTICDLMDEVSKLQSELKAADSVNEQKDKEIAKLKFMVSNGLGFEDLRNDI